MGDPKYFPHPSRADRSGLLAVGGQLDPAWVLDAYRHGIFPWPVDDDLLAWWSPDPRAVLELDQFRVPRRLARTVRSGRFRLTCDRAFADVIRGCATAQDRRGNTWITPEMRQAYIRLHELGHAHSVEVWQDGRLAGGTYGVAVGAVFAAESKFYAVRDASKVALVALVRHLRSRGFELLDIQQMTPHMKRMGASEITRLAFLCSLAAARDQPVTFGSALEP